MSWLRRFSAVPGPRCAGRSCLDLTDLERIGVDAFKSGVSTAIGLKFGLRIQSGDLTDPTLDHRVRAVLLKMALAASECAVFADFSDADLSDPSLVSPIIRGALEQLQAIGQWRLVVFLGTNYPEKNPAEAGQTITQPRNEWHAWSEAVKFDPSTAEHMIFGDFAADCAKIEFGGKGGRPIPHTRYATASSWLVVRGNFHRFHSRNHEGSLRADRGQRTLRWTDFLGRGRLHFRRSPQRCPKRRECDHLAAAQYHAPHNASSGGHRKGPQDSNFSATRCSSWCATNSVGRLK